MMTSNKVMRERLNITEDFWEQVHCNILQSYIVLQINGMGVKEEAGGGTKGELEGPT